MNFSSGCGSTSPAVRNLTNINIAPNPSKEESYVDLSPSPVRQMQPIGAEVHMNATLQPQSLRDFKRQSWGKNANKYY